MQNNPRVAEVLARVTQAAHEVVRDLQVTEDEWRQALQFVRNVVEADEVVLLSDVLGLSVLVDEITHRTNGATASNVEGPFYRPGAPLHESPALICRRDEPGEPLIVTGMVRGQGGDPLPRAIIDVWHTALNGLYDVQDDDQPEWNCRGRVRADGAGRYEFRTVVPVSYGIPSDGPVGALLRAAGRTGYRPAHIHYKVTAEGHRSLTTMVFFMGDKWLDQDAIGAVKSELVRTLENGEDGCRQLTFDVTLVPHVARSDRPVSPPAVAAIG